MSSIVTKPIAKREAVDMLMYHFMTMENKFVSEIHRKAYLRMTTLPEIYPQDMLGLMDFINTNPIQHSGSQEDSSAAEFIIAQLERVTGALFQSEKINFIDSHIIFAEHRDSQAKQFQDFIASDVVMPSMDYLIARRDEISAKLQKLIIDNLKKALLSKIQNQGNDFQNDLGDNEADPYNPENFLGNWGNADAKKRLH